jgi:hypothetical protein
VADVPSGLSLTPPQETKKKSFENTTQLMTVNNKFLLMYGHVDPSPPKLSPPSRDDGACATL